MKYALAFGILSLLLIAYAIVLGGWAWALLWPAASFLVVSVAYAGAGPRLLGKRRDGRIAAWALILLFPFFLLTWGVWHVQRLVSRQSAATEVAPGLWIGRRPLPNEVPQGIALIVDLTSEFRELAATRTGRVYCCLPTLDAMSPARDDFCRMVADVAKHEGAVLIHCAAGHGRTAMFAVALLVARGLAPNVPAALAILQAARPKLRLNAHQRRQLNALLRDELV
jgi:protein-tyrosine phosphatase